MAPYQASSLYAISFLLHSQTFCTKTVPVSETYKIHVTPHLITLSSFPLPRGYKFKILKILSNPAPTYIPNLWSQITWQFSRKWFILPHSYFWPFSSLSSEWPLPTTPLVYKINDFSSVNPCLPRSLHNLLKGTHSFFAPCFTHTSIRMLILAFIHIFLQPAWSKHPCSIS